MSTLCIRALHDFDAGTSDEISFREGAVMTVLDSSNPDWYNADYEGYSGMVPKNYFEEFYDDAVVGDWDDDFGGGGARSSDEVTQAQQHNTRTKPKIARMLYAYDAQQSDELTVAEGEAIQIMDETDPNWYLVKPIARLSESGLVPKTYCVIDAEIATAPGSKSMRQQKSTVSLLLSGGSSVIGAKKPPESEEEKRRRQEEKERETERKRQDKEDQERRKTEERAQRDRLKEEERVEREKRREQERVEREQYQQERNKMREEERRKRAEEERLAKEREIAERAAFKEKWTTSTNDDLKEARVVFYEKRRDGKYYFFVKLTRSTGQNTVYRTYQDFYDFHIKLMEIFPEEAGETGRERSIPYLPGQVIFVTEAICAQRRADLDTYCMELLALPSKISQSRWVIDIFSSKPGDEAVGTAKDPAPWSIGGSSKSKPAVPPGRPSTSAPSSTRQPGNHPPPPSSATVMPSTRTASAPTQPPVPAPPSTIKPPLKTISNGALLAGAPPRLTGAKVKVYQGKDSTHIVALMVDPSISLGELRDRIFKKLGGSPQPLQYRDEDNDLVTMASDDDVTVAFELHPGKLLLYTR